MSNIYHTEPPTSGKVLVHTTEGDIDIELWSREAPLACRNFIQLALEGYYDGTLVHRVIKGFMVQMGDPTGTGQGGDSIWGKPFKDEVHSRIKFNHRGQVAMANHKPNSNQSQFFITLDKCDWLDGKHTIFGKVTGNTIYNVLKMGEVEVGENERPVDEQQLKIKSIEVLWNPFDDIVPRLTSKPTTSESTSSKKKAEVKVKGVKNKKLLSFGEEEDEEEDEGNTIQIKVKSIHDTKKKRKAPTEEQESNEHDDGYEQAGKIKPSASSSSSSSFSHHQQQQQSSFSSSSNPKKGEEDDDEAMLLDEEAITQAMKKAKHEGSLQQKSKEYKQLRDELLRSRRAVHVLTGVEAEQAQKETAFHEMVTPLEQRRMKYLKRKNDYGDRSEDTFKKLNQFKASLKALKEKEKQQQAKEREEEEEGDEKKRAQTKVAKEPVSYHGQVLEKDSDEEDEKEGKMADGTSKEDWFAGKLKFKKHIDDQYRNPSLTTTDSLRIEEYEMVDPKKVKSRTHQ